MLGMVSQDDGIGLMSVTETLDSKIKAQEEKLKQMTEAYSQKIETQ